MVDWPATLPIHLLISGFGLTSPQNRVAFQPELGPPMVRRRGTNAPQKFTGTTPPLTEAQWEAFQTFFDTTTKSGTVRFNWVHPITGAAAVVMFDPDAGPPQTSAQGASIFTVSMSILVLP